VLAARVTTTVQVPGDAAFNTPLVMLQPAVPVEITANEYVPGPEPPEASRFKPVAYTPFVVVKDTADCATCEMTKFIGVTAIT
jgi:hypothetical protein